MLAILIPTLDSRKDKLDVLTAFLEKQIQDESVTKSVDILINCDNRQKTTGRKRNELLHASKRKFSVFVDDDDWVSDTYIRDCVRIIRAVEVDCIGMWGEAEWEAGVTRRFIHSLMCPVWTEWIGKGGAYMFYRHPNHLNPIRTDLARSIPYRDITISEDHHWTWAMARSGKLKREVFLADKCFYYYHPHGPVGGICLP